MVIFWAHGALGVFDELIALTVATAFFGMMIYAYIRSRALDDGDLPDESAPAPDPNVTPEPPDAPDRFKLD
ncbi:MAG: hypothetical protein MUC99_11865 [Anaerolineae bacterium]|jgi:hypothetical protein|nr:hypothetical protein [Anaerolineae bacterium]